MLNKRYSYFVFLALLATGCGGGSDSGDDQCTPSAQKCEDNMAYVCLDDGVWDEGSVCNAGCDGDVCKKSTSTECTAGAKKCEGGKAYVCSANGAWGNGSDCANGCDGNVCKSIAGTDCTAGAKKCESGKAYVCGDNGAWDNGSECANGCDGDVCKSNAGTDCAAGAKKCEGGKAYVCGDNGAWDNGSDCANGCDGDVCKTATVDVKVDDPCEATTFKMVCFENKVLFCDGDTNKVDAHPCDEGDTCVTFDGTRAAACTSELTACNVENDVVNVCSSNGDVVEVEPVDSEGEGVGGVSEAGEEDEYDYDIYLQEKQVCTKASNGSLYLLHKTGTYETCVNECNADNTACDDDGVDDLFTTCDSSDIGNVIYTCYDMETEDSSVMSYVTAVICEDMIVDSMWTEYYDDKMNADGYIECNYGCNEDHTACAEDPYKIGSQCDVANFESVCSDDHTLIYCDNNIITSRSCDGACVAFDDLSGYDAATCTEDVSACSADEKDTESTVCLSKENWGDYQIGTKCVEASNGNYYYARLDESLAFCNYECSGIKCNSEGTYTLDSCSAEDMGKGVTTCDSLYNQLVTRGECVIWNSHYYLSTIYGDECQYGCNANNTACNECKPGMTKCENNGTESDLFTCGDDGKWDAGAVCPNNGFCDADGLTCQTDVCSAEEENTARCSSDGYGPIVQLCMSGVWKTPNTGSDYFCNSGYVCSVSAKKCVSEDLVCVVNSDCASRLDGKTECIDSVCSTPASVITTGSADYVAWVSGSTCDAMITNSHKVKNNIIKSCDDSKGTKKDFTLTYYNGAVVTISNLSAQIGSTANMKSSTTPAGEIVISGLKSGLKVNVTWQIGTDKFDINPLLITDGKNPKPYIATAKTTDLTIDPVYVTSEGTSTVTIKHGGTGTNPIQIKSITIEPNDI